jgi:hypothetical protein
VGEFESAESLLAAAVTTWGASADRWVNRDVIQDEYGDAKHAQ